MAAGDLVVADGQFELRATLMGVGSIFGIDRDGGAVSGLLGSVAQYAETEYMHAAGSFIGEQYDAARTVTMALKIQGSTVATTMAGLETMRATWAPDATAEMPLHFRLEGIGKRYVNGWPLGIVEDISMYQFRQVRALASFRLTDPTIHTA